MTHHQSRVFADSKLRVQIYMPKTQLLKGLSHEDRMVLAKWLTEDSDVESLLEQETASEPAPDVPACEVAEATD